MAKYFLRLGEREIEAELDESPAGLRVNLDGEWRALGLQRLGDSPRYVLTLESRVLEVLVEDEQQGFSLQIGGRSYLVETARARRREQDDGERFVDGKWSLLSPLTGVVIELRVRQGQRVEAGDVVMVVEAMKMLNDLRSRVSGVVSALPVEEGQRVELGMRLLEVREQ